MSGKLSILDKLFVGMLLVIFGGIVLHAPLSVGLSSIWPDYELIIKSWKEILLGAALLLAVVILTTKKRWDLINTTVILLVMLFVALNLLLIPMFDTGFEATVAGLFINLRYFLFFVLVYLALRLYPQLYRKSVAVFVGGALVVTVFAILQVTVLPNDFLKHIGYGESTIMPYLTVDQNEDYVRINSTLRGPNPLGAYTAIVLAAVTAFVVRAKRTLAVRDKVVLWTLGGGGAVALWASYSRSAALAALIAVGLVLFVVYGRRASKMVWIGLGVAGLIVGGSLVVFKDTQLVSQVILHEDPLEGNDVNSNDGHADSLAEGTARMLRQPLGGGIGSTGSASLMTDEPVIIENQYLFVAHETGWFGLVTYVAICYLVLVEAWRRRSHWLALAVLASGVGLMVAALVLPVWADDTVSFIWWGLAGLVVALPLERLSSKKKGKLKS